MTSLTSKGQVTIPKRIRGVLGLRAGDEIDFEIGDGNAVIRKKPRLEIEKWAGYLGKHRTEAMMKELR
ncbi:AbrB/MazE/SpoVT family DNA-binding domain-containing protein [Candidatus Woesearchaeota archaeon]|nr:AbrB/MazE/SpoVT family DNA-binding domain-containing protein [Candidatus Woesearchaeota archaeon]